MRAGVAPVPVGRGGCGPTLMQPITTGELPLQTSVEIYSILARNSSSMFRVFAAPRPFRAAQIANYARLYQARILYLTALNGLPVALPHYKRRLFDASVVQD
jgi:hypothetical protein